MATTTTKNLAQLVMGSDNIWSVVSADREPGWSSLMTERDGYNFFDSRLRVETTLGYCQVILPSSGNFHLSLNSHVSKARCFEHAL